MKKLIRINEISLLREFEGNPDAHCIALRDLNYQVVDIPSWAPGKVVYGLPMGSRAIYIGPTPDGKRAVVKWDPPPSRVSPKYAEIDWDQLCEKPIEKSAVFARCPELTGGAL